MESWARMNESIESMYKFCPIDMSGDPRGVDASHFPGLRTDNYMPLFIAPDVSECQNVLSELRPLPFSHPLVVARAAEVILRQFEIERVRL